MTSDLTGDRKGLDANMLPQYGFGPDIDFNTLVKNNRFLYRVYTPKDRSPFYDDSEPFFVAARFDEKYSSTPMSSRNWPWKPPAATYGDVLRHLDWTTRSSSPYISTSFSFSWSIWEALRRFHNGMKKDVQIALIDAHAISSSAVTALQLLRQCPLDERRSEYWKWYRSCQESQSVLVYGAIPSSAVLSSVPLLSILHKLPTYFLRMDASLSESSNPLENLAWNYTEKKYSYRQFCMDMSKRFSGMSTDAKLCDCTSGSVRLALSILRPWYTKKVSEDVEIASEILCLLAFGISQWPAQWWVQDHSEIIKVMRYMALVLGEELQEKINRQTQDETLQIQNMVDKLENLVDRYNLSLPLQSMQEKIHEKSPCITDSSKFADKEAEDVPRHPRLGHLPHFSLTRTPSSSLITGSSYTPITPPDSPHHSSSFPSHPNTVFLPSSSLPTDYSAEQASINQVGSEASSRPPSLAAEQEALVTPSITGALSVVTDPTSTLSSPVSKSPSLGILSPTEEKEWLEIDEKQHFPQALPSSRIALTPSLSPTLASLPTAAHFKTSYGGCLPTVLPASLEIDDLFPTFESLAPELFFPARPSFTKPNLNPPETKNLQALPIEEVKRTSLPFLDFDSSLVPPHERLDLPIPLSVDADEDHERRRRQPGVVETASCIVTGFLIGAFITICLLGPPRRALLHLT